jgi:hypothetical protein
LFFGQHLFVAERHLLKVTQQIVFFSRHFIVAGQIIYFAWEQIYFAGWQIKIGARQFFG